MKYKIYLHIPNKKPPRSKNNSNPSLTTEQGLENKTVSQIRIRVEHSLSWLKRFNILCHDFRSHILKFIDDVAAVCAGLWNFKKLENTQYFYLAIALI